MKSYHIHRAGSEDCIGTVSVKVSDSSPSTGAIAEEYELPLEPSLKVYNHSPTGFEFGYRGSGPAQLALAILLDYTQQTELALDLHQAFKWKFITPMDHPGGVIGHNQIEDWLADNICGPDDY